MRCFLFSLTLKKRYNLKSDKKERAIFNYPSLGAAFGDGHDLCLYSDCDKTSSYAKIGHSYENEPYASFTGGTDEYFSATEYEVYGLDDNNDIFVK